VNHKRKKLDGILEQWLFQFFLVTSVAITVARFLVNDFGQLRETFGPVQAIAARAATNQHKLDNFGQVSSEPLHDCSPAQLVKEIKSMANRKVATRDIIDQIVLQHLAQQRVNTDLKIGMLVHRHNPTSLVSESERLAELQLSTQEIVERLLVICENPESIVS